MAFLQRNMAISAATTKQKSYLASATLPVVIKASGLAAGKVVVIAEEFNKADEVLKDFMLRRKIWSSWVLGHRGISDWG